MANTLSDTCMYVRTDREVHVGISEAAMKEIHQKAQDEKQVLMKQAQVSIRTALHCCVLCCVVLFCAA